MVEKRGRKSFFQDLAIAHTLELQDPLDLVFQRLLQKNNSWSTPKWTLVHLLAHSQQIPVAHAAAMWEISHSFDKFQQADPISFTDVDAAAGVIMALENPQLFLGEPIDELLDFGDQIYQFLSLEAYIEAVRLAEKANMLPKLPDYYRQLKQTLYRKYGNDHGATYGIAGDLVFGFIGVDAFVKKGGRFESPERAWFELLTKAAAREIQANVPVSKRKVLPLFNPPESEL